jgi:hypothetical protein
MERPRYFVLKGCAGLGNRLITLSWVIRYCIRTRRILLVDWSDGMFGPKGENQFQRFFELNNVPHVDFFDGIPELESRSTYPESWKGRWSTSIYDLYDQAIPYPFIKRLMVRAFSNLPWNIRETWVLKPEFRSTSGARTLQAPWQDIRTGSLLPLASSYPDGFEEEVLFGADYLPSFDAEAFRRHITFGPEVTERLEKVASDLRVGKDTVGIHVRQTDWTWNRGIEPLLRRLHRSDSQDGRRYFLATDSADTLEQVRKIAPSVIVYPKFLPKPQSGGLHHWAYHTEDRSLAMKMFEESLIDLFLLSRCGTLWHQRGSSFSTIAHAMADPSQRTEDWTNF